MQVLKQNKKFLIHIEEYKCTDCKICMVVCSLANLNAVEISKSKIKVLKEDAKGYRIRIRLCRQCTDAPCIKVCPVNAIFKDVDGVIRIRQDKCIGCRLCAKVCPYDSIFIDNETGKAYKCELCEGLYCFQACPTNAISYIKVD